MTILSTQSPARAVRTLAHSFDPYMRAHRNAKADHCSLMRARFGMWLVSDNSD